jgi:hypothetical protein
MMNPDLQTLAWRYALGELEGAESASFEGRLETDQSAREALADVVILMSAIRQAPQAARSLPATGLPAGRRSRIAAVLACSAACLLFVVLVGLPDGSRPVAHRNAVDASAIVGTWSDLADDELAFLDGDGDFLNDDGSSDVPDWMVAAVLEDFDAAPLEKGTL